MKVLCIDGIPARGLLSGSIYTQANSWTCCGRYLPKTLVSVEEAVGHLGQMRCWRCQVVVPNEPTGWFDARRFVPWNPPALSKENIKALYAPTERPDRVPNPANAPADTPDFVVPKG